MNHAQKSPSKTNSVPNFTCCHLVNINVTWYKNIYWLSFKATKGVGHNPITKYSHYFFSPFGKDIPICLHKFNVNYIHFYFLILKFSLYFRKHFRMVTEITATVRHFTPETSKSWGHYRNSPGMSYGLVRCLMSACAPPLPFLKIGTQVLKKIFKWSVIPSILV